jgi:DNA-binding NarL/FixJ family response regulator
MEEFSELEGVQTMSDRKKIADRLTAAKSVREAHSIAEELRRDKRVKVTPETRDMILKMKADGYTSSVIAMKLELSAPTVRKIIRQKERRINDER